MKITRPIQERFNMSYEESFAFWLMIIREYSYQEIRSSSLLLIQSSPLVSDKE